MTKTIALMLSCVCALAGCGAVRSYPLPMPRGGPQAIFPAIADCATAQRLPISRHPDSVNVEVDPGVWVQFMDQGQLNMVIVVMQSGPDANVRADGARQKGDAIYRCAAGR
jgi:hypothetical protein